MGRIMVRWMIVLGGFMTCVSSAYAKAEYYEDGLKYCIITLNDNTVIDNTNNYYYFFDRETGSITLRRNGTWKLKYCYYTTGSPWADVPHVNCGTINSGIFKCTVEGRSIREVANRGIDFSGVMTAGQADLCVILHRDPLLQEGGSIPALCKIDAPGMIFRSSIDGDVAGTIRVRRIGYDDPYCQIGGDLTASGMLQVDGDIGIIEMTHNTGKGVAAC